ncbi:replication initiation and membrane attachment family protein [Calditerricola satsumensis]|uniref:Replication initiation and membrane attachment protein n=3 Tax=Calditerricola satsumensis TaxID=373054 RepID=A0A8J3FCT9_9BACI|nr:DnaD domain protein [Calditerricola satsumensis]GGJ93158.1 replication initiation and membrane attachment protein [Calditerricola satsumensis]
MTAPTLKDAYVVRFIRPIAPAELGYVLHLYQPIIGHAACALYLTLLFSVPQDSGVPQTGMFRWLVATTGLSLDALTQARRRLEAVGLLRTFHVSRDDGDAVFEFLLYPPLPPARFLADDVLNVLLFNALSPAQYRALVDRYGADERDVHAAHRLLSPHAARTELTAAFGDVFVAVSPETLSRESGAEAERESAAAREGRAMPEMDPFAEGAVSFGTVIDEAELEAYLPEGFPRVAEWPQGLREAVQRLAFLFGLDAYALSVHLQDPFVCGDDGVPDAERLKQVIKQAYLHRSKGKWPRIAERVQPPALRTVQGEPKSREEAHIRTLETLSPVRLIERHQGGAPVSEADLRIVEALLEDYRLPPGVVNVLIEYVMITNDYKLPRNLVFKIAAHWKRKKVQTVPEALAVAREEHQLYQQWRGGRDASATKGQGKGERRARRASGGEEKLASSIAHQLEREREGAYEERRERPIAEDEELLRLVYELEARKKGKS